MKDEDISLTTLPSEILLFCFSFLNSVKDLVSLSKTNHSLRKIALDQSLWRNYSNQIPKPQLVYATKESRSFYFTAFAELNNGYLASAGGNTIHIYETKKFKRIRKLQLKSEINVLASLPDNRLAAGCRNGTIEVWKLYEESSIISIVKNIKQKKGIFKKSHRETIIKIAHCCASPWQWYHSEKFHDNIGIKAMVALPNGLLASGDCCSGKIYIWDTYSGKCITKKMKHPYHQVTALAVLDNGNLLSGSSGDGNEYDNVRIWNVESNECILKLNEKYYNGRGLKGNLDTILVLQNNCIAISRYECKVRIYDLTKKKFITSLPIKNSKIAALPSGKLVSANYHFTDIHFWNIKTSKCLYALKLKIHHSKESLSYNQYSNFIILKDGTFVCGRAKDRIYVYRFPSVPEDRLSEKFKSNRTSTKVTKYK